MRTWAGGVPVHILEAGIAAASRALPGQLGYLESVMKQVSSARLS